MHHSHANASSTPKHLQDLPKVDDVTIMPELRTDYQALLELMPQCLAKDCFSIREHLLNLFPARNTEKVTATLKHLLGQAHRSSTRHKHRLEAIKKVNFYYDPSLPIASHVESIADVLRNNSVIILSGETGSGKSTQLPKICLHAGFGSVGKIGCTQPRRIAATSIARRIAQEMQTQLGQLVGSKVRFTDNTSQQTQLQVMTDGILLSELQNDPLLLDYSCLIIDEAHERSLNIDFLLGYIRELTQKRPELKVIITSATLDTEKFSKHFNNAPIINIPGRSYPVEIRYAPLDSNLEASGDYTYINGAADALAELILSTPGTTPADILVFLPGERDIRELNDLLNSNAFPHRKLFAGMEILPLYSRLTAGQQDRIFQPCPHRKIILATNIAETSLTIPTIRYVIDSGLARISRYSTNAHTQRLPIEPISQSSANQRAGRCGRVAEGICIRLYDVQDYLDRPKHTSPEILRANLASVILRLKSLPISELETFPFVDAPSSRALNAGLNLLIDLGALDEATQTITTLGKEIAQLPVDPTFARILLQAHTEKVVPEVLVIASALSIQDPRERPHDNPGLADAAHKRFQHPTSDFITLLNLWNAIHSECERLSQNQLRKFCKQHFLSYTRIREWRDIYEQLTQILKELDRYPKSHTAAPIEEIYPNIHRSLLAGLPAHIALRDEGNFYKATHSRNVMLFPGSALFDKNLQKRKVDPKKTAVAPIKSSTPKWILCAQFTETSNLFAITCSMIDPSWVSQVASHLFKFSFTEPYYEPELERVLVKKKSFLYGLLIRTDSVAYGVINPTHAREIFINCALVEDTLKEQLPFLVHNRAVRQKVEDLLTRERFVSAYTLDDRLFEFYNKILPENISSIHELTAFSHTFTAIPNPLYLTETNLLTPTDYERLSSESHLFPQKTELENTLLPLSYVYAPGEDTDGVTIRLTLPEFEKLTPAALDWMVPGFLKEKILLLLKSLPKAARQAIFPIADKAESLTHAITKNLHLHSQNLTRTLPQVLAQLLNTQYPRLNLTERDFNAHSLPNFLMARIEVTTNEEDTKKRKVLASDRNFVPLKKEVQSIITETQRQLAKEKPQLAPELCRQEAHQLFNAARKQYEIEKIENGKFGTHPLSYMIGDVSGVPLKAFPGLMHDEKSQTLALRLFADESKAFAATETAHVTLCRQLMKIDLGYLQKDLKSLSRIHALYVTMGSITSLQEQALENIEDYLFYLGDYNLLPLDNNRLTKLVNQAHEALKGLVPRFVDLLQNILSARHPLILHTKPYPQLAEEINDLLTSNFLQRIPFDQLQHIPRYLKAMQIRCEKYAMNPAKDKQTALQYQSYWNTYQTHIHDPKLTKQQVKALRDFYFMLQEFKVSLFAQQLGTAQRVSAKKLDEMLSEMTFLHTRR
jgi:ATP-dependent helicase HrpA